jgi:hypothetical protein
MSLSTSQAHFLQLSWKLIRVVGGLAWHGYESLLGKLKGAEVSNSQISCSKKYIFCCHKYDHVKKNLHISLLLTYILDIWKQTLIQEQMRVSKVLHRLTRTIRLASVNSQG